MGGYKEMKTKKTSHLCEVFSLVAPSLGLPDFAALYRDKLLAQNNCIKKVQYFRIGLLSSLSWARTKDPLINSQML